jgi:hypothetical protein
LGVLAASSSILLFRKLPRGSWRGPIAIVVFVALLPLPLIDEIAAKPQFEQLCRENATVTVDPKAAGKTVYLATQPRVILEGPWVRVAAQPWQFVDVNSGEIVVAYNTLQADGGRFVAAFGIGGPLLFNGWCGPANRPASAETFKRFGIQYIEPPVRSKPNER